MYDVVIIGSGPGGLSAALFCERQKMNFIILENPMKNSMLTEAYTVENYPGHEKIQGFELFEKMKQQTKSEIVQERVLEISKDDFFTIKTDKNEYQTKSIIVSTGSEHRKGNVEGEEQFLGKGVSYCVKCDGAFFRDKTVVVVGGGDSAVRGSISLMDSGSSKVYLLHRRDELRAANKYIDIAKEKGVCFLLNYNLLKIQGENLVNSILIQDNETQEQKEIETNGVFFEIGVVPASELIKKLGVETTETGAIIVDKKKQTNIPGVFAAGDVTDTPLRQIITACADGAIAADSVYKYVNNL